MTDSTGSIPWSIMFEGLTRENLTFKRHLLGFSYALFYGRCKNNNNNNT